MKLTALKTITIALSIFAAASSLAATPAKKKPQAWAQEPDSFMGLRFDKKVDEALPLCPPRTVLREQMCHEAAYQNLFTVAKGPDIGFGYGLSVFAGGEGVESFYLTTGSENFPDLAKLLTAKYGPAMERAIDTVKTKGGAEFNNETLTWKGKKILIFAQKYSGDINTSTVTINTLADSERQAATREQKSKESASKL